MIFKYNVISKLSADLNLPFSGKEQDWDIELANSSRIREFLMFYHNNLLSKDEKYSIMALIIASYDDYLNENCLEQDEQWIYIKEILLEEPVFYKDIIKYWALEEEKTDDLFKVTHLIRELNI